MQLHNITTAHSYRAILIPKDACPEELEQLADAKLLPVLQLKAASASHATPPAAAPCCASSAWRPEPWPSQCPN